MIKTNKIVASTLVAASVFTSMFGAALAAEPMVTSSQAITSPTAEYYVTAGETLEQVAVKHDMTTTDLLGMNPQLMNASTLRSGEKVYVPWRSAYVHWGVNFRTAPTTVDSQVLFMVPTGATVYVLEDVDASWAKVRYVRSGTEYIGYISKKYHTVNEGYTAPLIPAWEQQADTIIAEGQKYMGVEYEFGAPSYYTNGTFDCSSYTQYLYYQQGIQLPRDSRQQSQVGTYVSQSDLRKGDLMFFTTSARKDLTGVERVGHVGIYMGDGKILHTYKVGVGVTISSFKYYWADTYLFSKRVIRD